MGKRKKGLRSSSVTQPTQEGSELFQILQEISRPAKLMDTPRRIELCRRALELVPRENASDWAALQIKMGNSLAQYPLGNRADNIEMAIYHYEEALKVYIQKDFPENWAGTQNNLGLAYNNRIRGDRADNIEQAIEHFNQALKIYTQEDFPADWAMTRNNLAAAYSYRIRGDRADNIEQAIMHYDQALKVRTQEGFPADWATTQNNLAAAYSYRIRGDRADNIEQAIMHYEQALKVRTQEDFPADWAMTQNNLAAAYNNRIRSDRADNIEQAIEHYNQALKICTQKDFPDNWAATQNNLAAAYSDRIRSDRADNIEQAIEHFDQALKVYTQKDFPIDWAMTQNNLANAYKNRIQGNRADNIEQAIEHYNQALKVRTKKDFPADWAMTQNNLAAAYSDRIRGDRAENIEQAIELYNQALKVRTQKDFPSDWAMTQNGLANAHKDRILGDRADNIEQAIELYKQALNVFTPREFPSRCRGTAIRLGNLCLEVRSFSEAGKAYSLGMDAAEELYIAAIFQTSRDSEMAETRDLYQRASYALARSGIPIKAVVAMERGRARGLGLSLARDRADMERVQEKDPLAYKDYWQAVEDLQNLESQERAGVSAEGKSIPHRDLMMQARTRLGEALGRIRRIPGYQSFLKEPDWKEIAAATIEDQPVVYLAATTKGGIALIVHRSSESKDAAVDAVDLEAFPKQRLLELLYIWFEAYEDWHEALTNLIEDQMGAEEYLQTQSRWFDTIETVTGQLWKNVIGPVFGVLQSLKAQQVFLIPTVLLSLLPLHAAWRKEDGPRQYLLDLLLVSYIPSARTLAHVRRNAGTADRLLAVDEPRTVNASPLPNSHAEVMTISSLFNEPLILEHENATRSAVLQSLPGAQVAHFSCHGGADWSDPEQSGLSMANDEILTIKDLFELHLAVARLATLSACETGVSGIKLPDEVVSLPSAFIRAGFAGAIGSLWTVSDESTARLMTSFYQLWRVKGMLPVEALAEAQKELRKQERFQHPFYWAAFYLTGV